MTKKGPDGKTVQETVVDWFPTSGSIRHFFNDVLIAASKSLKQNLLDRVGSYGLNQVASYAPEYFSGYNAEVYTVDLDDAHGDARRYMEYNLEEMARQDVLRRYDEVRAVNVRASYSDETYKHVLLPVYATAYSYKGKKYHVLINGQSGRVEGDYPKSPAKIIAIILGILAVLFLVFLFSTGSDAAYTAEAAEIQQYLALETASGQNISIQKENEEAVPWEYLADSLPM